MYRQVERERDVYIGVSVCVYVYIYQYIAKLNTELVGCMSQIPCTLWNVMIVFEILSALQVLTNNMKACFFPASLEILVVNVYRISIMQFAVLHN